MNYKELTNKSAERRFADIIGIKKENLILESKPLKKIKDNWIILLAVLALVIGLLLVNFKLQYFLMCLGLIALFTVLFIIGNKYTVTCDKKSINVKQNFQNIHLPYNIVKNVYISKTIRGVFGRSYVLVIRCEDNLSLLREFEFPLLCADITEVEQFVENFKISDKYDESVIKRDKRRSLRAIVENVFAIVCVIFIVWFLIVNGIIKMP